MPTPAQHLRSRLADLPGVVRDIDPRDKLLACDILTTSSCPVIRRLFLDNTPTIASFAILTPIAMDESRVMDAVTNCYQQDGWKALDQPAARQRPMAFTNGAERHQVHLESCWIGQNRAYLVAVC